ncbi:MAG TPA: hypothetical protein EYP40_01975 [Chromatiales bacterium]|nr:hypothetical protein [Chromatiales bacterium]
MSDKLHESLSALADGELDNPEPLIRQLGNDPDLKQRWLRYHVIRDSLTDHMTLPDIDISAAVCRALESEPAILAPAHHRRRGRLRFLGRQAAGLAIAATVSAVAVLGVQHYQNRGAAPDQLAVTQPQALPARPATTPAPLRLVSEPQSLDSAVQNKLSNYLVKHNEYSVSSNMQGMMPYMRIVSVTPGERVEAQGANEQ